MATLKFRHLILYFICFTLLYFSDFPGGALISIASWLQVCVLLWGFTYNLRTQAKVFIYFLTLIPIYFLLGSSSAFSQIYIKENSHLYFLLSCVLTYSLSLLAIIFSVLSFKLSSIENGITDFYLKTLKNINKERPLLLKLSLFLFLISILPMPMKQDYKISLAIILIHLYLNQNLLKNLARLK